MTAEDACLTVYVTVRDAAAAEELGTVLVRERLAACANVLPGMVSVYEWQGAMQRDTEAVLLLKTRATLFAALQARILSLHAYELPCIVAWPIAAASAEYVAWVRAQTDPR
jgi:periplasmic divalent cation tolerance protein